MQSTNAISTNALLTSLLSRAKTLAGSGRYMFPDAETGRPYGPVKTAFNAAVRRAGPTSRRSPDDLGVHRSK